MNERGERAAKLFHDGKANCAQAVLAAFDDVTGLDERAALRISSSFGGGMGKLREVCGAVSGAAFVLGALRGYGNPDAKEEKTAHYARVQDFAARFKAEHDTIICRDLLKGIALKKENTPEPEARTDEYYRVRPCVRFVMTAARVLDEMLAE